MPPKLRIFERKHIPLRHIERDLLVRKTVTARLPPQLHRLEEEVHDDVDARECHNMTDHGDEITRCKALSLHDVAFHADVIAGER